MREEESSNSSSFFRIAHSRILLFRTTHILTIFVICDTIFAIEVCWNGCY